MSNKWKSQGGINRRSYNNIITNNKQSSSNLTIPQQLGAPNTTIRQYGDNRSIDSGAFYKMIEDGKEFRNVLAYYPFNNLLTTNDNKIKDNTIISNTSTYLDTTSNNDYSSNFNMSFHNNSSNNTNSMPSIIYDATHSQHAIQFTSTSKYIITNKSLNTLNAFGQTFDYQAITSQLTIDTFLYIPPGSGEFCIFAFDDMVQSGLTDNEDCFYLWFNKDNQTNNTQIQ